MNEPVALIHPIYLDVPMVVSFAAAIEGGLAFQANVTDEISSKSEATTTGSARIGFSGLFSRIFDAGIEAGGTATDETGDRSTRTESRAHTEASVAILLYHRLSRESGYIVKPESFDDLSEVKAGSLVEIAGTLEKNAVNAVIDYIDAAMIYSTMKTEPDAPPAQQGAPTRQKGKKKAPAAPLNPVLRTREALNQDRSRTPISNVRLRCTEPTSGNAILTLRTENLRDLTLSELHKNSVRVVGKVTRVVPKNETMSAFENLGLAMLKPETLATMFSQIASSDKIVAEFSDVTVTGPALQVLPMMIFV